MHDSHPGTRNRALAAALGGLGILVSACSGMDDQRSGLSCIDDSPDGKNAFVMAEHAVLSTLLGPAAVSIHDDGNMPGQAAAVNWGRRLHWV